MERLTEKFVCNLPNEVLVKLGIADVPREDYEIKEVFGSTCKEVCEEHECSNCPIQKVISKLADYEDAEEQGLLLRLPCSIGSIVYSVVKDGLQIFELKFTLDLYVRRKSDFGKTVFLTKDEAELALKQMGE